MNPEMLQLNMRVMTPKGSGRIMPFFDEDPDTVVCQGPDGVVTCRVKLDETGEQIDVKFNDVKSMPYK